MNARSLAVAALLITGPGLACTPAKETPQPEVTETRVPAATADEDTASGLGEGFLVWESNRSGRWRLWWRDLQGGEPRQLTPDEGERLHCCPHISPDGRQIAYLSLDPDQQGYPQGGAVGTLMLIRPDGTGARVLMNRARNYYENRAVVWRSADRLIFIREDGRTAELDLGTGESSPLIRETGDTGPWLIDPTLTWAASGLNAFAPYDADQKRVVPRGSQPGCQAYFSHDGVWGFWMVAPGGPIGRVHLGSGRDETMLKKSDPRLPVDLGYLYFPMLSADNRLFTFAASNEAHPHFGSDYEVFVAETDPDSLEIIGRPVRFTHHPATDRFPDVHLAPLPLGRWRGEAPYSWVSPPLATADDSWQWDYGDGATSAGATGEHVFEQPGSFRVVARRGSDELIGRVVVSPPQPPEILSTSVMEGGRVLVIVFDEPVDITGLEARLESGVTLTGQELDRGDRRLRLLPAEAVDRPDVLILEGIRDRAPRPNLLGPTRLSLEPPSWPVSRERLAFLWETADAVNLVWDRELEAETAVTLTARGRARLDSNFAMLPAGGQFRATDRDSWRTILACKKTYEISIEMHLEPDPRDGGNVGVVLTSASKSRRNFTLEQEGQRLFWTLRMANRGPRALPRMPVVELSSDRPAHIVLTYAPGELVAYLDGQEVTRTESPQGGFFQWKPAPLFFGTDWNGEKPWHGRLEGVAIWARALTAVEARESYQRYQAKLQARPTLSTWNVTARVDACSAAPTLEQIDPYREALVVCRYRIEASGDGSQLPPTIEAARWSLLDGQTLPLPSPADGATMLDLGLFDENPQLESVYLSDTLEPSVEGPLYFVLSH